MKTAYQNLVERSRQIASLQNISSMLSWDEAVMMPRGSGEARGREMGELAALIQKLSNGPEIGDWLNEADLEVKDSGWERANLREMRRAYVWNTAVPVELNQKLVQARFASEQNWRELRAANDWKSFLPFQREILALSRESLGIVAAAESKPIYNTALEKFSPGLSERVVEKLFDELKTFIPEMIARGRDRAPLGEVPTGEFPVEAQRQLGRELMGAIGFSFERGRLDESHHPFCGGTAEDVRITTRYEKTGFLSALMGVLHETGHALYEQNLPAAWAGQPVGGPMGMAIHESQSLFWEMQICRSPAFQKFSAPKIQNHLGAFTKNASSLSADNLSRLNTQLRPGLIRVDADEVTYPAHVILRFEIERELVNGRLKTEDLPEAFNAKLESYLGLSAKGDERNGCMQDVHWPAGYFGYFPAYTFGAVIAAQLFQALKAVRPSVHEEIASGEFGPIQEWLRENIWSKAASLGTLELVEHAVGPLSAAPFRAHLESRFGL